MSLLCAVILVKILLTGFNSMFNYDIHLRILDYRLIVFFISVTVFTSLISGLLPALYLASSRPVEALKGKIITSNSYSIFRQSLIVFQFTIPIVLIVCMMIIRTQDRYMRNFNVGVDADRLIVFENTPGIRSHEESIKSELLQHTRNQCDKLHELYSYTRSSGFV